MPVFQRSRRLRNGVLLMWTDLREDLLARRVLKGFLEIIKVKFFTFSLPTWVSKTPSLQKFWQLLELLAYVRPVRIFVVKTVLLLVTQRWLLLGLMGKGLAVLIMCSLSMISEATSIIWVKLV
ncbi:hypothetical protein Dsin_023856 [Dipteronia sinensis]|uniref:Uncharacterized protein n=1 Tax=Dipteronia sinensis TaxID=43782 RepID=A0AAE0E1B3_9ROSI|nr:hypothetical protein Dsin_023856 [Dipteronia sinensis]